MALSLVGTAGNTSGTGGNITVTHPVGIAAGDAVFIMYAAGNNTRINHDMTMQTAGYTELADVYGPSPNDRDCNMGIFRKIMGETPDSTAVTTGVGGTGSANAAVEQVWRGVDATTPEDATTQSAGRVGDGTATDTPSITTVTADTVVLTLAGSSGGATFATATAPTNYSDTILRTQSGANGSVTAAMASRAVAAIGTEDPGAWGNWSVGTIDGVCEATVAIRPAATGPVFTLTDYRFYDDTGTAV